jgi:acyl carrier protein phosphodiesterase
MAPMNHLAHAFLAGADDAVLLGGLLGDFWRGAPDPQWPAAIRAGVVLHRKIDVYTDSHAQVAAARALFVPPLRRYAGILLDVYFDHVLAAEWPRQGREPLADLSARVDVLLRDNRHWLPPQLNRFADYFHQAGLFASYADRDTIERVLAGIARRLKHENPLAAAGPALWQRESELRPAFARFFPELVAFASLKRGELLDAAAANNSFEPNNRAR